MPSCSLEPDNFVEVSLSDEGSPTTLPPAGNTAPKLLDLLVQFPLPPPSRPSSLSATGSSPLDSNSIVLPASPLPANMTKRKSGSDNIVARANDALWRKLALGRTATSPPPKTPDAIGSSAEVNPGMEGIPVIDTGYAIPTSQSMPAKGTFAPPRRSMTVSNRRSMRPIAVGPLSWGLYTPPQGPTNAGINLGDTHCSLAKPRSVRTTTSKSTPQNGSFPTSRGVSPTWFAPGSVPLLPGKSNPGDDIFSEEASESSHYSSANASFITQTSRAIPITPPDSIGIGTRLGPPFRPFSLSAAILEGLRKRPPANHAVVKSLSNFMPSAGSTSDEWIKGWRDDMYTVLKSFKEVESGLHEDDFRSILESDASRSTVSDLSMTVSLSFFSMANTAARNSGEGLKSRTANV